MYGLFFWIGSSYCSFVSGIAKCILHGEAVDVKWIGGENEGKCYFANILGKDLIFGVWRLHHHDHLLFNIRLWRCPPSLSLHDPCFCHFLSFFFTLSSVTFLKISILLIIIHAKKIKINKIKKKKAEGERKPRHFTFPTRKLIIISNWSKLSQITVPWAFSCVHTSDLHRVFSESTWQKDPESTFLSWPQVQSSKSLSDVKESNFFSGTTIL